MSKQKKYAIKAVGKPDPAHIRQTSSPKTPEEQVQALADTIQGEIFGYNIRKELQLKIDRDNMRVVQGVGGVDLRDYKTHHEAGYQSEGKKIPEKTTAPELKKVSKEKKQTLPVNDPKFFKDGKLKKQSKSDSKSK